MTGILLLLSATTGKMVGYREGNLVIFKGMSFAVPPTG